ncbi:MAG: hypothetical protein Q7U07_01585 [Gammaproteobacteria bacterium]|nr:hypothetical protein [Gammaproteobacteria bacterium]
MADDFARHVAAGIVGPIELERLSKGFTAHLGARGAVSLERCLGLSETPAQMARDERDMHLIAAWRLVDGETPWKKSLALAVDLEAFQCRIWRLWRHEQTPPAGSSELRRHLFFAVRAADCAKISVPKTARHLHNIVSEFVK